MIFFVYCLPASSGICGKCEISVGVGGAAVRAGPPETATDGTLFLGVPTSESNQVYDSEMFIWKYCSLLMIFCLWFMIVSTQTVA